MWNWSIIKEKYENAYYALLEDQELSDDTSTLSLYDPETDSEFNIRKLYDFFDARDIECYIIPGKNGFEKIPCIFQSYKGKPYESRREAEADLFSKAFELLEQKMTNPVIAFSHA